jgi:hypothetical protein
VGVIPASRVCAAGAAIAALVAIRAFGGLDGSYVLPLDDSAIQYASRPLADPVTLLEKRIERGETKLDYDPDYGYLISVLRNLKAPVSSQVLVFSKTSFQAPRISPRTPRALYFNDPRQGVVFYILDQEQSPSPRIVRRDDCLQCHATGSTLGVPGFVVRSVYPEPTGMPLFHRGGFITDHRSPLAQRWGGYYVTGSSGTQTHLGNLTFDDADPPLPDGTSHSFDGGAYLSPHSDMVALMTLEHQSRMQNLITRVGYEARMALDSQAAINQALKIPVEEMSESTTRRIHNAAEELVSYMLFTDETPLTGKVAGTSGFASDFEKQGPLDRRGRSLRQFDLTRRMFRYPCSYLIYSEAFDNLPGKARDRVYLRLWEVLSGQDRTPAFARLAAVDRQAILEILLDTKKGLPGYWVKLPGR